MRKINNTDSLCYPSGFIPNSDKLFYVRANLNGEDYKIELFDYKTDMIYKVLSGYMPARAALDNAIYYIVPDIVAAGTIEDELIEDDEPAYEPDENSENITEISDEVIDYEDDGAPNFDSAYVRNIYKYDISSDINELITTITLDDYYHYDIDDIAALTQKFYCYNVYSEHEYRYFYQDDGSEQMFYPLLEEPDSIHEWKEQFDLTFSNDGKYAVYTERNWNELTYIVVIDLIKERRIQTPYYGSFPEIIGDRVYFLSDPDFVKGGNTEFRQINSYALYAYNISNRKLNLIKNFKGTAGIIKR